MQVARLARYQGTRCPDIPQSPADLAAVSHPERHRRPSKTSFPAGAVRATGHLAPRTMPSRIPRTTTTRRNAQAPGARSWQPRRPTAVGVPSGHTETHDQRTAPRPTSAIAASGQLPEDWPSTGHQLRSDGGGGHGGHEPADAWRRRELARVIARLAPPEQAAVTAALGLLVGAAGDYGTTAHRPVPL
jgi:hypothetical protein